MIPDKCPKCGAVADSATPTEFECGSYFDRHGNLIEPMLGLCIPRQRDQLAAENAKMREDLRMAAGELLVPMPEPGTDMARLLSANVLLRQERDRLREHVKRLEEVGDYWISRDSDAQEAWAKAKEAKP